jgi:hypothetical protein
MVSAGVNTVRTYSPIAEGWVLDQFAAAGIRIIMGFTANSDSYSIVSGGYLDYVNTFKNHSAILFWELGNEYNYHPEWFGGDVGNWYEMLEHAAQQIHLIDPDHPVSTAHGEVPTAQTLAAVPSVDVWGMNVYRWDQSQTAITDFAAISNKPCYISEAGGDSYNSNPDHPAYGFGVNEQMQADAIGVILSNIFANLDVGSGVAVFEYSDEWWKAGDPNVQDPGGSAPNSSSVPYDGAANEEYWGVVDVFRSEKLSFDEVRTAYTNPACLVSAHAGLDQYLAQATTATVLDGSASSPAGALSFDWSQTGGPSAVSFSSTSSAQPVISGLVGGLYSFSLEVTGGCGSSTDTVAVMVAEGPNTPPVSDAGPDQFLSPGSVFTTLDGSASYDPDSGPAGLEYSWQQTDGPLLGISDSTLAAPIVAGVADGGSYTFELLVSDGLHVSAPSRVTLFSNPVFVDGFESGDVSRWLVVGETRVLREVVPLPVGGDRLRSHDVSLHLLGDQDDASKPRGAGAAGSHKSGLVFDLSAEESQRRRISCD